MVQKFTILHLLLIIIVTIIVIITIQWRFTIIKAIIIIKADPSRERYRKDIKNIFTNIFM